MVELSRAPQPTISRASVYRSASQSLEVGVGGDGSGGWENYARARNTEGKTLNTGHISPTRHMCQSQKLPEGGLEPIGPFSELTVLSSLGHQMIFIIDAYAFNIVLGN